MVSSPHDSQSHGYFCLFAIIHQIWETELFKLKPLGVKKKVLHILHYLLQIWKLAAIFRYNIYELVFQPNLVLHKDTQLLVPKSMIVPKYIFVI